MPQLMHDSAMPRVLLPQMRKGRRGSDALFSILSAPAGPKRDRRSARIIARG